MYIFKRQKTVSLYINKEVFFTLLSRFLVLYLKTKYNAWKNRENLIGYFIAFIW